MPHIHYAQFTVDQLHTLLEAEHSILPYAYLESEVDITLASTVDLLKDRLQTNPRFDHPQAFSIAFSDWIHGRVFGESGELRWTRQPGGTYDVMWLTETEYTPLGDSIIRQEAFDIAQERPVLLIGKLRAGAYWAEARYPRPAQYPGSKPTSRVYLNCVDYLSGHLTIITRMKNFAAETE